ncbi:hypothetical protein tb265_08560 [Gemmatimonadetes bacterium T265]|nr:hypothetical protein tb265_08560 [Gemmatimonadetes bacterium T265]
MTARPHRRARVRPRVTRGLHLAYPALLAVVPILYRQAQNPGPMLPDAVVLSAVVVTLVALVQGLAYAVLRLAASRQPTTAAADWAAALAAAAVVLLYLPVPLGNWVHAAPRRLHAAQAAGVVAIAVLPPTLWWALRRDAVRRAMRFLAPAGRILASAALVIGGWSGAQVALAPARADRILRRSALVQELARPVTASGPAPPGPRRDLYVILLDEYPAAAELRGRYAIDNAPFLDSLRALGFRTPSNLWSNYAVTLMSIGSLLNFAQLRPLDDDAPAGYRDYTLGAYLIQHNRAARFLKQRGYRFAFFPSLWFAPTRHDPEADVELAEPRGFDLARTLRRSPFAESFWDATLLPQALPFVATFQATDVAHATRTFAGVAALAARPADSPPVFAFAHVLMPHAPFVADAACRPYPRGAPLYMHTPRPSPAVRAAFAGFVACVNRQVLATARTLLARPGPRPLILLQGDHGTQALQPFDTPPDALTPAQVRERFRPFGAYYLPDGGAAAMPDTVSIVNVLRVVFRYYFGADLPPVPNARYFSHFLTPYTLTEIDTLTDRPRPATRAR